MARIVYDSCVPDEVKVVHVGPNLSVVEVMIVGDVDGFPIYFRLDGIDPEVQGEDCEVVPPALGAALATDAPDGIVEVRLISEGSPLFSVRGS